MLSQCNSYAFGECPVTTSVCPNQPRRGDTIQDRASALSLATRPPPFPLPFAVGEWEGRGGKKGTSPHTGLTPCAIICHSYRAFALFTGRFFQRTLCQCHWHGGCYYWALMSMPICPFHLRYQLLVSSRRVRKAVFSVPLRIAIFLARYDGSLRRSATRMRS